MDKTAASQSLLALKVRKLPFEKGHLLAKSIEGRGNVFAWESHKEICFFFCFITLKGENDV